MSPARSSQPTIVSRKCWKETALRWRKPIAASASNTRHTDIVMVLMEPIDARQFPQWSMACIGPSQSAAAAAERVTSDVPHSRAGDGARALTNFMSRMLAVEAPTPAAN